MSRDPLNVTELRRLFEPNAPGRVLTVAELREQNYDHAPQSAGLTAADFRGQYATHGRPVRFWKAIPLADGTTKSDGNALYIEQEVGEFRALFHDLRDEKVAREFGFIRDADALLSTLPDEIEPFEGDFILDALAVCAEPFRAELVRGSGNTDILPQRFPLLGGFAVTLDGVAISPASYSVVSATTPAETARLVWSNPPATGTRYTVVGKASPLYRCLGESIRRGPVGTDGARLPQRTLLRRV